MGDSDGAVTAHYWCGDTDAISTKPENWSESSGGGNASAVPDANDPVHYDGGGNNPCTLAGDVSWDSIAQVAGYTSTFDWNDHDITLRNGGDATFAGGAGGTVDCGSGTLKLTNGNFDNSDYAGTWTRGTSTVEMAGVGTLTGTVIKGLHDLTIAAGAAITVDANMQCYGKHIVNGSITINGVVFYNTTAVMTIGASGNLSGNGVYLIKAYNAGNGITSFASGGIIDIGELRIVKPHVDAIVAAGTYQSALVKIACVSADAATLTLSAGTYVFSGNLEFENTNAGGTLTVANNTNNPVIMIKGSLTIAATAGTITYNHGTGVITASGSEDAEFDVAGQSIESLVVNKGATTHSPTTAAEIITAVNSAAAGSIINLPAGSFDCSAEILAPARGVEISGHGASTTILKSRWLAVEPGTLTLADFAIDISGLASSGSYGVAEFRNGTCIFRRMRIGIGFPAGSENCLTFYAGTHTVHAYLYGCEIDHGGNDTVSTKALNSTVGGQSAVTLVDCNIHDCGPDANDQLVTSHVAFPVYMAGGSLHTPGISRVLAASDDTPTPLELDGVTAAGGTIKASKVSRCICSEVVIWIKAGGSAEYNTIENAAADGLTLAAGASALSNYIDLTGGSAVDCIEAIGVASVVKGNVCIGATDANRAGVAIRQSASGAHEIVNNTVVGCYRGIYIRGELSPTVTLWNNIVDDSVSSKVFVHGGSPSVSGKNNCFGSGGTFTGYTPDATDVEAEPDVSATTYLPDSGGNCDSGEGYVTGVAYTDWYGTVKAAGDADAIGAVYP